MHEIVRGFGDDVEEMIEHSKYSLYIHFTEMKETHDYDLDDMLQNIGIGMALWERSFERKVLYKFLRKMVISKTAQVSNIVCLGHGSLDKNYASILQHVAAVFIAQDL
jgi:hypothetical protein